MSFWAGIIVGYFITHAFGLLACIYEDRQKLKQKLTGIKRPWWRNL